MDELAKYIVDHYHNLLTFEEKAVYKSLVAEFKIKNANRPEMKSMLRKAWVSNDPRVVELLAHGPEAFMESVRDRVLHEHRDEVVLNHCPKCFFAWHGDI